MSPASRDPLRPGHSHHHVVRRRRQPRYVAICLLALLGLAAFTYASFTKRVPFSSRFAIQGIFASANQLRDGSPVRIAGVDVGTVIGVGRGPGTTARVTMAISNEGRPIHADARMQIRPRLFLEGGFYVQLSPGTPSAPILGDGDTVPLAHTSIPVQVDQVLSVLDSPTRASIKTTIGQLASGLQGGGAASLRSVLNQAAPTLRDATIAAQAFQGERVGDVQNLMVGASRVSATLAAHDAQLEGLLTGLDSTSTALDHNDAALAASLRGLDATLIATPPALHALDGALPRLTSFVAAVRPALPEAPAVLTSARQTLDQVRGLTSSRELPALLDRLSPTLATAPTLEQRLDGLLPLVTPVVSCVRDKAVPSLNTKLDDGALSTGRPAWQDLAHTMVGLASAAQDFDADGPWIRFLDSAGTTTVSTGSVPGLGELVGSNSSPIVGSRPQWLGMGNEPPFRPDQPCESQPLPNFTAASGPAMASDTVPRSKVTFAQVQQALHSVARGRR